MDQSRPASFPDLAAARAGSNAARLRLALIGLVLIGAIGTLLELASLKHWSEPVMLIPWVAMAVAAAAAIWLAAQPGALSIKIAKAVAVIMLASAAFGMWEHVEQNYNEGHESHKYGAQWATMSETSKWWYAATQQVGPTPPLAVGIMAEIGLCLGAATIGAGAAGAGDGAAAAGESETRRPASLVG